MPSKRWGDRVEEDEESLPSPLAMLALANLHLNSKNGDAAYAETGFSEVLLAMAECLEVSPATAEPAVTLNDARTEERLLVAKVAAMFFGAEGYTVTPLAHRTPGEQYPIASSPPEHASRQDRLAMDTPRSSSPCTPGEGVHAASSLSP